MNKELIHSYNILRDIYLDKRYSSIQLNQALNKINADNINTKLITKIVYGVLENDLLLNYNLKHFYDKKPKPAIIVLFKMAMYIANFTDSIPNYAMVNELVNIAKKSINKNYAGFVNAVLKKIVNHKIVYPNQANFVEFLSVKYSYPEWLVKMLIREYGKDDTHALLQHEPTHLTHIRVNTDLISYNDFVVKLNEFDINYKLSLIDNALYVDYDKLLKNENEFYNLYIVQGLTSAKFIDLVNKDISQINSNNQLNVFDVCASPGGKSLYLAQLNKTANIIAADIHPHRVQLIEDMMSKFDILNVQAIENDATKFVEDFKDSFDVVICDAPCSGIGVAGKKPDILLNRQQSDINTLQKLQLDILNNVSKYVKVNGLLFYATCTILKQENEDVIDEFLITNPNFELMPVMVGSEIEHVKYKDTIKFLPHISNTEGFFIAKIVRKS